MDILLTFAGNRDPFNPELVQGTHTDGPVLTLLEERSFHTIFLFTTPNTISNARDLQEEIQKRLGLIPVKIIHIDIPDPTDYEELYVHMSRHCLSILEAHRNESPCYFIAAASGTLQMQTIWFLLTQSGIVPATLLKITPPRFLKPGQKAVSEIHLSLEGFPRLLLPSEKDLDMAATLLRKQKLEAERVCIILEFSGHRIIGKSPTLTVVNETIEAVSQYDSAVLIQGETGTGKELAARAIHFNSARKTEPFIVVNCAAIPESLVESELFGHEKGSFTGAIQQRKGKFELADGGTIFLDEIGDMPLPAQAKILRILQDYEVTRVGGIKPIKTNVRVIAATNRNLAGMISEGKFREDLYYRLKIVDIRLPALRERREDIPLMVEYFLNIHNNRFRQQKQVSREAMRCLIEYRWPGNVRELENAIERAFVLSKGNIIKQADLPLEICEEKIQKKRFEGGAAIHPGGMDMSQHLESLEKSFYEEAIRQKDGNREAAARLLGIKPHTFRKRAREKFRL